MFRQHRGSSRRRAGWPFEERNNQTTAIPSPGAQLAAIPVDRIWKVSPTPRPERRAADDAIAARSGHRSRDSWSTQVSTGDNETEFEAAGPKKG